MVVGHICSCLTSHFPHLHLRPHQEQHTDPCLKLCAVENLNKPTRQSEDPFEAGGDECRIENYLLYFGDSQFALSCASIDTEKDDCVVHPRLEFY